MFGIECRTIKRVSFTGRCTSQGVESAFRLADGGSYIGVIVWVELHVMICSVTLWRRRSLGGKDLGVKH